VGVGNACRTGVGPGVGNGLGFGLRVWAKAVEQTIDVPRTVAQIMGSLIDVTRDIRILLFLGDLRIS
jgi:hypothetical protein